METSAPLSILVVDDDPFMLELMRDMLETIGRFAVRTESSARAGLAALAQQPDLLICDLSMPDIDGIEFLNAAAEAGYGGRVLLMSGMAPDVLSAAERLATAQGLDVLGAYGKPIAMADLRAALDRLAPPAARRSGQAG
ncbi:MAG TPA: response regulator [Telluria sp.]|nr:response regulator [Telluria sp.]